MIGILMTKEGIPVAHQVFPGNTTDVDTFKHALFQVKDRSRLGKVILVGDRGMVSEKLLNEIEKAGLEYIVGVKMRKMRAVSQVLYRHGRYSMVKENLKVKEVCIQG
ncbi:MAG: transposase [Syntrophomonadaceae bacterium]|nr:transposase [Syntrophomonadaceae bacterium]